jgi:hypothetical protein
MPGLTQLGTVPAIALAVRVKNFIERSLLFMTSPRYLAFQSLARCDLGGFSAHPPFNGSPQSMVDKK